MAVQSFFQRGKGIGGQLELVWRCVDANQEFPPRFPQLLDKVLSHQSLPHKLNISWRLTLHLEETRQPSFHRNDYLVEICISVESINSELNLSTLPGQ